MKKYYDKLKELNKSQKYQIVFSVLLIVIAIVAVVLNLTGIHKFSNSALLSIIIVLLCSVSIVYILNEFDVFDETNRRLGDIDDTLKNVEKLVRNTRTTKGVILPRRELEQNIALESLWENADEVCLLAIANTGFLRGNGISKIQEAVNKGVRFKIVSLNPGFSAIKEYVESSIMSDTSLPVEENINSYIRKCKSSGDRRSKCKDFSKMVELRLTTYLLPYSMMIVKKNNKICAVKIDLYGVEMDYMDRRSFYIYEEDEKNIKFYSEQWDSIWNNEVKTIPVDKSKTY